MTKKVGKNAYGMNAKSGHFVITGTYLRKQAKEAVTTFVAPVSGAAKAFQKAGKPAGKDKTPAKVG